MTIDKRKTALAALANHARRYQVTIPERLHAFYAGNFESHHLRFVTASPGGWSDNSSFQLALTPPTWLDKDDDAINGPDGEWEDAKYHVPLFITDQALYAVANLQDPHCPVSWYYEEGFRDGPAEAAGSLDEFLASLTATAANPDEVATPSDPDQNWEQDFDDDGPRVFDVDRGDD